MKNKGLYLIACIVSVVLILPSLFSNSAITGALSGIGCSGLAAGIMAIFLELSEVEREQRSLAKARQTYFNEMNSQLIMVIERLLWFNDRLNNEDFNWNLDLAEYSSLRYMIFSQTISQGRVVSFHEAESMLTEIGQKYNLENIKALSDEQRRKVQRMFLIVASSSVHLLREVNTAVNNKLLLNAEEYITIDEIKKIYFDISLAIGIMQKNDKNYEVAIKSLLNATKKIREIGDYNDSVHIGLHGSFGIAEL